jgi:serine/threonine-protein kinase
VGTDGMSRVLDFGIAKALGRLQTTSVGQVKGKLPYMAPEQLLWGEVSPRTDVYAAAVVLWEALTGRKLFNAKRSGDVAASLLASAIPRPRTIVPDLPADLDAIVMRGLEREASARFATARDFAVALEDSVGVASARQVGEWVAKSATPTLAARGMMVLRLEEQSGTGSIDAREVLVEAAEHHPASPAASEETAVGAAHDDAGVQRDSRGTMTMPDGRPSKPTMTRPDGRPSKPTVRLPVALKKPALRGEISVSTFARDTPTWHGRALSAAIAAPILIALGLVVTLLNVGKTKDAEREITTPSSASPALAQAADGADPEVRVESEPHGDEPHGDGPPVDEPSPISSPPPVPPQQPVGSAASASSHTAKAPAPSKSARCLTYYFIDKNGIKRLKPECL